MFNLIYPTSVGLHILITLKKREGKFMIALLIFGVLYFGLQIGVALVSQLFYGVGLLLVIVLGISFMVGKQRNFANGVVSITLKGLGICVSFLVNFVAEMVRWAFNQGPKVYKKSKNFFVNNCGIGAGISSVLAGLLAVVVVILII